MNLLVIGAAGMIGRKLSQRLSRDGRLARRAIKEAHLADIVTPPPL
jgi:nucleoside-diphosphate-sugar epimerase